MSRNRSKDSNSQADADAEQDAIIDANVATAPPLSARQIANLTPLLKPVQEYFAGHRDT